MVSETSSDRESKGMASHRIILNTLNGSGRLPTPERAFYGLSMNFWERIEAA